MLYKTKDERFNKMYLQLAADKERITMAKDKFARLTNVVTFCRLERSVLVLHEEYKKRVSKEGKLVKYIKKLRRQQGTDIIILWLNF
jgi:hypothetical protein